MGFLDGKISARNVIIGGTGEVKGDIEYTELLRTEDGASMDGYIKKVPLVSIENKVTNFLNTSKEPRREKQKKL